MFLATPITNEMYVCGCAALLCRPAVQYSSSSLKYQVFMLECIAVYIVVAAAESDTARPIIFCVFEFFTSTPAKANSSPEGSRHVVVAY